MLMNLHIYFILSLGQLIVAGEVIPSADRLVNIRFQLSSLITMGSLKQEKFSDKKYV